ncbi:response regulator [Thermogemmatispora onikobensis]|uniref:response regulator n=1 Tax=Thermogemmatispora onikobensis TaxID=732234 RepID=UPI000853A30D|nr:response regulator [Thermogemmatispora onikobensis]
MRPGPTILVVDDSLVCRTVLRVALSRAGYQVQTCSDGLSALSALTSPGAPPPDLLLLDWLLPHLSGLQLTYLLRHQTRSPQLSRLPILMLSCRHSTLDRLKARLAGASAFLAKPFTIADLLTIVHNLLSSSPGPHLTPLPPPPALPPVPTAQSLPPPSFFP